MPTVVEDTDASALDGSSGEAPEEDGSSGYIGPEICPCEQIDAAWRVCEDPELDATEALRERTPVVSMGDRTSGSLVAHDGSLFAEIYGAEDEDPNEVHRWSPDDAEFAPAFELPDGDYAVAMASSEGGLLVLLSASNRLVRWTAEGGMEELAELGDWDTRPDYISRQPLRVPGDRAVFGVDRSAAFDDAPADTVAVVQVDLTDGTFELLPEPLAGVVPTEAGWIGLRPQVDEWQFCLDYACFVEPTAIARDLVTASSTVAADGCVDASYDPQMVHFAALHADDYISVSHAAARRNGPPRGPPHRSRRRWGRAHRRPRPTASRRSHYEIFCVRRLTTSGAAVTP